VNKTPMGFRAWFGRLLGVDDRVREPQDYGGGLIRLPDPDPQSGMLFDPLSDPLSGEMITFEVWAERVWERYGTVRLTCRSTPDDPRSLCPYCYEVGNVESFAYLSRNHNNPQARRRFTRHYEESLRKIAALGACRCGCKVTGGQAAAEAAADLRRYHPER
jgi:hypothetical protein